MGGDKVINIVFKSFNGDVIVVLIIGDISVCFKFKLHVPNVDGSEFLFGFIC